MHHFKADQRFDVRVVRGEYGGARRLVAPTVPVDAAVVRVEPQQLLQSEGNNTINQRLGDCYNRDRISLTWTSGLPQNDMLYMWSWENEHSGEVREIERKRDKFARNRQISTK